MSYFFSDDDDYVDDNDDDKTENNYRKTMKTMDPPFVTTVICFISLPPLSSKITFCLTTPLQEYSSPLLLSYDNFSHKKTS